MKAGDFIEMMGFFNFAVIMHRNMCQNAFVKYSQSQI